MQSRVLKVSFPFFNDFQNLYQMFKCHFSRLREQWQQYISAWPQIPVAITTWDSSINDDVFIVHFCIEKKEMHHNILFFLSVSSILLNSLMIYLISLHVNTLAWKYIGANCTSIWNGFLVSNDLERACIAPWQVYWSYFCLEWAGE